MPPITALGAGCRPIIRAALGQNHSGQRLFPERSSRALRSFLFILTVEDEFLISEYLRGILEAAGHNVVATFDAEEAIAVLETDPGIEVVITDINLPGSMDGLRLAAAIRDRWPPIRLIVATGQAYPLKG